jgi:CheY-like chemotaxis protein
MKLQGCHVLVVEDDEDSREVIRVVLEVCGATVATVGNATQALAALAAGRFHAIVSDLAMPEQSGFWLIRKIREKYRQPHLPALAVTGHAFPGDQVTGAGFDDLIRKPPDPAALCAALSRLIGEWKER